MEYELGKLMRWISMAMKILYLYLYASLPDMAIPKQFALRTAMRPKRKVTLKNASQDSKNDDFKHQE